MRRFAFCLLGLVVALAGARAAEVQVQAGNEKLPQYRPALLGSGPNAVINRIDTKALLQQGQKDAAVMFSCSVAKTGEIMWSGTYRGTPDSKLLEEEVLRRLADAKFVPAVYNHQTVDAIFYGTVFFANIKGKPRLRIFANQEAEELKKESDFISPQPFVGPESGFTGFHYPEAMPVLVRGMVELALNIDENGNLVDLTVGAEEPPLVGLGAAAVNDFSHAKFIPAFRAGKPVASRTTLPVYYKPRE
ncbi:MAG: energy transducer TonB [Verrucomicrobiota bacterium]|nr:energy transducer TonB [Verrucomicrobiota bacterium]